MVLFEFNEEKNILLKEERGVNFEDILEAIKNGDILDNIENKKYKNQKVYVIKIKKYAYAVPYIVTKEGNIFLKTLYPSRKLTKQYINKHNE
ncbi:MAG: toxin [bacterium]|nr:toxin [bacterium]